jgi:heme iron utilization protein
MAENEMASRARRLFARAQHGMLSTLSAEMAGYPFGSVVIYARDRAGRAMFLISKIAEHTRNVARDNRASLTVAEEDDGADAQACGRLTVVGHAVRVPDGEQDDAARRLYRRFPHAEAYHRTHDFDLYRLEPVRARYIGGFGDICWLEPRALCEPNPFPAPIEEGMLAHMNCSHVDAMRGFCRLFAVEPGEQPPRLAAIDHEGFDLMVGKHLLRIEFDEAVCSPDEVRRAMVALALQARESGLHYA